MDSIQYLLKGTENLWNNYVRHEFVIKMKEGTLPLDVFRYYLIQDAKYVEDMLKAVLLASSKGPIDIVTKILQAIFYSRDKGLETNKNYIPN